eukprot:scaffold386_cov174-Ochromonas_danica.AAC.19
MTGNGETLLPQEEDPVKCAVCLDGEVYENNEIVFCDKCNVAVHQLCYGVKDVPPVWIPELYEIYGKGPPTISLAPLDIKRYKLKCSLCTKKGACVQCSYGRCTAAAHPWCVFHHPQGFTKRIVKTEDGSPLWEIFCKNHAAAVSEPVKPRGRKHSSSGGAASSSSSSAARIEESVMDVVNIEEEVPVGRNTLAIMSQTNHFDSWSAPDSSSSVARKNSAGKGHVSSQRKTTMSSSQGQEDGSVSVFPLLSLLEWPGISEGEGMDLDHYWNYVSSYYPEDHSKAWLDFMLLPFQRPEGWQVDSEPCMQTTLLSSLVSDPQRCEEIEDQIEDLLTGIGNERIRSAVLNPSKRDIFLSQVAQIVESLTKGTSGDSCASAIAGDELVPTGDSDSISSNQKIKSENVAAYHPYGSEDLTYFIRKQDDSSSSSSAAEQSSVLRFEREEKEEESLRVIMDGTCERVRCLFRVEVNPSSSTTTESDTIPVQGEPRNALVDDAKIHVLPIPSSSMTLDDDVKAVVMTLESIDPIPSHVRVALSDKEVFISKDDDDMLTKLIHTDQHAYAALFTAIQSKIQSTIREKKLFQEDMVNLLPGYRRDEKEIVARFLKQQSWKFVASGIVKGMKDQTPDFNKPEFEKLPASWALEVEGRGKGGGGTGSNGITAGEDDEPHEDAICMCCFDGTSTDQNRILFCDGCNMTIHQRCYGIEEIPEGEYYCNRCQYIQSYHEEQDLSDEEDLRAFHQTVKLKDMVKCALCPVYHGGLKPTTCNRWVHLACCMWAEGSIIRNLPDMTEIDISQVPVQVSRNYNGRNKGTGLIHSDITTPCVFCKMQGGYVVRCNYCERQGNDQNDCCNVSFHPLCAWFHGAYIKAVCSDPTFQALDRPDHLYPAGVVYSFFCIEHSNRHRNHLLEASSSGTGTSPPGSTYIDSYFDCGSAGTEEQRSIRNKYCISLADLEQLPGAKNSRRKRKKFKKRQSEAGGHNTTHTAVVKELPVDKYDCTMCAYCMLPMTTDIFNSGFDINKLILPDAVNLEEIKEDDELSNGIIITERSEVNGEEKKEDDGNNEQQQPQQQQQPQPQQQDSSLLLDQPIATTPAASTTNNVVTLPPLTSSRLRAKENKEWLSSTHPLSYLQCSQCGLCIHTHCAEEMNPHHGPYTHLSPWTCFVCSQGLKYENIHCALCPRHGGLLLPTTTLPYGSQYMHVYCAQFLLPQFSFSSNQSNSIDFKVIPKEYYNKNKCRICNRKNGITLPCGSLGCSHYYHPLCGKRSSATDKCCIRSRNRVQEVFCPEHLPDHIDCLLGPSSSSTAYHDHLDFLEISKFFYMLERSRLIIDQLLKREKNKRSLVKAEERNFQEKFRKLLDRAMHRKSAATTPGGGNGGVDEEDALLEEEEESDSDDYDSDRPEGRLSMLPPEVEGKEELVKIYVPLNQDKNYDASLVTKITIPRGGSVPKADGENGEDAEEALPPLVINSTWCDPKDLPLPVKTKVFFAGREITRRFTMRYSNQPKSFVRHVAGDLARIQDTSRPNTMIFENRKAEEKFLTNLIDQIRKLVNEPLDEDKETEGLSTNKKGRGRGRRKERIDEIPASLDEDFELAMAETDSEDGRDEEVVMERRGRRSRALSFEETEGNEEEVAIAASSAMKRSRSGAKNSDKNLDLTISKKRGRASEDDVDRLVGAPFSPSATDAVLPSGKKARRVKLSIPSPDQLTDSPAALHVLTVKTKGTKVKDDIPTGSADYDTIQGLLSSTSFKQSFNKHFLRGSRKRTSFVDTLSRLNESIVTGFKAEKSHPGNNCQLERRIQDLLYLLDNATEPEFVSSEKEPTGGDEAPQDNPILSEVGPEKKRRGRGQRVKEAMDVVEEEQEEHVSHVVHRSPGSHLKRTAPRSPKELENEEGRSLTAVLETAPYDSIPEYNQYVRRLVTLESMRVSLQKHIYRSMEEFSTDFYILLNNARAVTETSNLVSCRDVAIYYIID